MPTEMQEQEEKDRKKRLRMIIAKEDARLTKEHHWQMSNVCSKCHMVLTTRGTCPMDC